MAREVLPWVGAIVGGLVSYGNPYAIQAGFMIGSMVGNTVDPQIIKGPSIGDGQQTTSQEGQPRPKVWGTGCVGGNIIARGELQKVINRQRQGKSMGPVTEEERFLLTYAIRVAEGPLDGIVRIWEDEKLSYDIRLEGSQVSQEENQKYAQSFRFYNGSEEQMPDSELEAIFGVGNTPAYRGTAYIVFPNRDLTHRGGSVPNYRFEISTSATVKYFPDVLIGNNLLQSSGQDLKYIGQHVPNVGVNSQYYPSTSFDGRYMAVAGSNASNPRMFEFNEETGMFDIPYSNVPQYDVHKICWHPRMNIFINFVPYSENVPGQGTLIGHYANVYSLDKNTKSVVLRGSYKFQGTFPNENLPRYASYCWNDNATKLICCQNTSSRVNVYSFNNTNLEVSDLVVNQNMYFNVKQGFNQVKDNVLYVSQSGSGFGYVYAYRVNLNNTLTRIGTLTLNQQPWQNAGRLFFSKNGNTMYRFCEKNNTANLGEIRAFRMVPSVTIAGNIDFIETDKPEQPQKVIVFDNLPNEVGTDLNNNLFIINLRDTISGQPGSAYAVYKIEETEIKKIYEGLPAGMPANVLSKITVTGINGSASAQTGEFDVSMIIQDIAQKDLRISLDKIDIEDVADISCKGLIAADQYTAGNIIRSLQSSYFFDVSEYDEKIHFIKRGKPIVQSISYSQTVNESYELKRGSSIEYPRKIELLYQSPKVGYAVAKAFSERISPDVRISGVLSTTLPVTLDENDAAKIADKMHKISWAEAEGEYSLELPTSYQNIVTGDCIAFFTDPSTNLSSTSISYRLRVDEINTADGIMKLRCKIDKQNAYTSNATGNPLPTPTPPPPTIVGETLFAYLDIPALVDENDVLGYYVSGTGRTQAWRGAQYQRANNPGDEFLNINDITQGLIVGELLEPINTASEHYTDTTNVIVVKIPHNYSEMHSVSEEQLLQERNSIAIQRLDGTAEIMQFRDAQYMGNGVYRLTNLLRGRLNSTPSRHSIGSKMVYLEDAYFVSISSSHLNTTMEHRAISYGQVPEEATTYDYNFKGVNQIEFPVDLLRYSKDGDLLTLQWSPRERFGTEINPIRSINWDRYEVVISDSSQSFVLTSQEPQIVFDTSVFTGTINATVYQFNRITGRGYPASISL